MTPPVDFSLLSNADLLEHLMRVVNYPAFPESGFIVSEVARRIEASEQGEEDVFVLPVSVSEAIRNHFGPGRRTFEAMTKRVKFAYQVWQGKYGPWSLDQAEYAESLVLFCINKAVHGENPGHSRALVYTWLDKCVNHENTHAGFKSRADQGFDITSTLQEIA